MEKITLIAAAKFGLEKVIKMEALGLGFENVVVSDGRVSFDATLDDIPRANLWFRCADRILLNVGEFHAEDFDDLFDQTKQLPWERWITEDGVFTVNANVHKSTIDSTRSTQAIVKKAVVERLKAHYDTDWFAETGAEFTIQVTILKDETLLTIDTSGMGLHKRGYRQWGGEAPLKETLAAALVMLSFWNKDRLLIDPMCGSGTILIEAAMIARNMAPGLKRPFASEEWPCISGDAWRDAKKEAREAINREGDLQLFGYDIDEESIALCKSNAQKAGVADDITFAVQDVKKLWIDQQYGVIISNPPYGLRLGDFQQMNDIYLALHKTFKKKSGWSVYILTADEMFPKYFKRAQPNRVRKLYNGRIQTRYYQYYGDKPPVES